MLASIVRVGPKFSYVDGANQGTTLPYPRRGHHQTNVVYSQRTSVSDVMIIAV